MKLIASIPIPALMAALLILGGTSHSLCIPARADASLSVRAQSVFANDEGDGDEGGENDGDCQSSDCTKGTGGK